MRILMMMGLLCAAMTALADAATPTADEKETVIYEETVGTEETDKTVKNEETEDSVEADMAEEAEAREAESILDAVTADGTEGTSHPGISDIPRFSIMPASSSLLDLGNTSRHERWAWNRQRDHVKPYTFMQDMTWVGVPLFVAGIIAKKEKKSFRQDYNNIHSNTRLLTHFKSEIDNYTQYFGPVMATGLKIGGVEGRSDWGRYLTSAAMGYAIMAALVNTIKYTAKEMRPDGSTTNSWPSGHTATSFVGATILHKEYGLTHSPWYSVAGYTVATATGIMRVLNNRHWVSDVLSGAGIGIVSGELGYALADLIFKKRGLRRNDATGLLNENHPSFFSVSMGVGIGNRELDFGTDEAGNSYALKFQAATAVGVEGAYFLNKYVGLGGRLRVKSTPIKGWNNLLNQAQDYLSESMIDMTQLADEFPDKDALRHVISDATFTIESDHLTEFAADLGVYFNFPITRRLSLGTKLLGGRSFMQELDLDAHFKGEVINMQYEANIKDGQLTDLSINDFTRTGETYDHQWDYATVKANNSTKWGTGLSLTYAYKHNFHWKLFADFDYTKKDFKMQVDTDSFSNYAFPNATLLDNLLGFEQYEFKKTITKYMRQWTFGASFSVAF